MVTSCHDCNRPYGDEYGFCDLVVPHDVWNNHISPNGDSSGMLCPSCMVKRANDAGVECGAAFRSGPFFSERGLSPIWQPIETAPKDGAPILVTHYVVIEDDEGWHTQVVFPFDHEFEGMNFGHSRDIAPWTHWMPLPPAPDNGGSDA